VSRRRWILAAVAVATVTTVRVDAAELHEHWLLDCGSDGVSQDRFVPAQGVLDVDVQAPAGAVLVIEERGRDMEIRSGPDAAFEAISTRPPRLGLWAGTHSVQVKRSGAPGAKAPLRATLYCAPDAAHAALPACSAAAQALAAEGGAMPPAPLAGTPLCRALLQHALATFASRSGSPAEAARLYTDAIDNWRAAGDASREGAAWLGLTEQRLRLADHRAALVAAERAGNLSERDGMPYFAARARAQACLIHGYLGDPRRASDCLGPLPDAFMVMGEPGEAANTWYSLGLLAADAGRVAEAESAARQALAIAPSAITPIVRGRLLQLSARLALEAGRIDESIAAIGGAIAAFETAGDLRWQGNAYLFAAELHHGIGADAEARVFAEGAVQRFNSAQAPARLAAALLVQARILAARDTEAAWRATQRARALYVQAQMPMQVVEADVTALSVRATPEADRAVTDALASLPARRADQARLALAAAALRRGDRVAAGAELERLSDRSLPLATALERDLLRARLMVDEGAAAGALSLLERAIDALHVLARRAGTPGLRYALARRLALLRRAWVDAYLADPAARPGLESAWSVLARTQVTALLGHGTAAASATGGSVDRALAGALLAQEAETNERDLSVQRELMHFYAERLRVAPSASLVQRWGDVGRALAPGQVWIAFALGEHGAIALKATSEGATLHRLDSAEAIRRSSLALREALSTPTGSVAVIEAEATRLGERLFPGGIDVSAKQLWVMADDALASVPWALLRAPGDVGPLIERMAVSTTSGVPVSRSWAREPPALTALVASLSEARHDELAPLFGAEQEPRLIADIVPDMPVTVVAGQGLNETTLLETLAADMNWVHVAAHGTHRGGLPGYSGLWLAPVQADAPLRFVGWLALADTPLHAGLVVLNACQLAQADDLPDGGVDFATALAAAGVAHVVAARWTISDAASAQWVPAFYAALNADRQAGPAFALRAAQLRMRAGRAFRHPYYWASLVHRQQSR